MTISMRLELTVFILNYKYPSSDITMLYLWNNITGRDQDFPDLYSFHYSLTELCILYDVKNHCFLLMEQTIDGECNFICS